MYATALSGGPTDAATGRRQRAVSLHRGEVQNAVIMPRSSPTTSEAPLRKRQARDHVRSGTRETVIAAAIIARPPIGPPDTNVTGAGMTNITEIRQHRHLPDGRGRAETLGMSN